MPGTFRYRWSWGLAVLLCVLFQFAMPIAGDEAYFISWGKTLSGGFFDHPPLIGWVSFGLRRIESLFGLETHGLGHRLFSLALGGVGLWLVARRFSVVADIAPVSLALIPGYLLLFNLYMVHTFLVFTVLVFVLASDGALRARNHGWLAVLCAGLALGAMLLSEYTGVLVYLGMVLGLASWPEGRRFLLSRMTVITAIAGIPFGLHVWWNLDNCNVNLSILLRLRDLSDATDHGLALFALGVVLMSGATIIMAVPAAWRIWRNWERFGLIARAFTGTVVVVLADLALGSGNDVILSAPLGILAVLALCEMAAVRELKLSLVAGYVLSVLVLVPLGLLILALHLDLIAGAVLVGDERAREADLSMDIDNGVLVSALRPLAAGRVIASEDYAVAASFDNAGFPESTVLSRSWGGRNQDMTTDFRALDGRDMLLVGNDPNALHALAEAVFRSYRIVTVTTKRRDHEIILGNGFRYPVYREKWILPVLARVYSPTVIPSRSCYMDRYR